MLFGKSIFKKVVKVVFYSLLFFFLMGCSLFLLLRLYLVKVISDLLIKDNVLFLVYCDWVWSFFFFNNFKYLGLDKIFINFVVLFFEVVIVFLGVGGGFLVVLVI